MPLAATPMSTPKQKSLPLSSLLFVDEFNGPRSGLPKDASIPPEPEHGRSDGLFYVYSRGGFHAWNIFRIGATATCEIVARVLSDAPRQKGAGLS